MSRRAGSLWETKERGGLFSDRSYLLLSEYFYDPDEHSSCRRYYVVDLLTDHVKEYGISYQGYTDEDLSMLLPACGYRIIGSFDSLTGETNLANSDWQVVVAEKPVG
jgi:hypothetical protein